jgi:hypothetical protein
MDEASEILNGISKCQEQGQIEDAILATKHLTEQLNANETRSRQWNSFHTGQVMARLGYEATVTRTTYQRGWRIRF